MVAGLLGLSSDDVFRRAERERRRKGRVRNGIIATLAILAVAATGSAVYAWQQLKTNEAFLTATLKRATDIVDMAVSQAETYGVPRKATLALLTQAEGLFDDMARLGRPTAELRYQKSLMLIQFARNYAVLGDTHKWKERAEAGRTLLVQLLDETPGNPLYERNLSRAEDELGDVAMTEGNLAEAANWYRQSFALTQRLADADPSNIQLQRDLSVSNERLGDILLAQGQLDAALEQYRASLARMVPLRDAHPDNLDLKHFTAVTLNLIGDALLAQGKLGEALDAYRGSVEICEGLTKVDPDNTTWQRELGSGYQRVGDALFAEGDLAGALEVISAAESSSVASC